MTDEQAMQHGALSAEIGLPRRANPFEPNGTMGAVRAWQAWDEGYSRAIAQWRAEKRAEIADTYGDEAADQF